MGVTGSIIDSIMKFLALVALFVCAAVADDDVDALMDLHKSTGGASWTRKDNWGSGDKCTWFGVQCTHDPPGTSQVFSVSMPNNNLKGAVPDSISKIASLKVLELNNNQLSGPIPSTLASLKFLQMVHLQHNELEGALPATIMNLNSTEVPYPPMQELDFSYNKLSGDIPESMWGPEHRDPFANDIGLKVFNLRYNAITGNFPSRMPRAVKLVSALFGGNNMTGVISDDEGSFLTSRKYCDLSGNTWTCPLPNGVAEKCQAICK